MLIREIQCSFCGKSIDESEKRWDLVVQQRQCPYCHRQFSAAQLRLVNLDSSVNGEAHGHPRSDQIPRSDARMPNHQPGVFNQTNYCQKRSDERVSVGVRRIFVVTCIVVCAPFFVFITAKSLQSFIRDNHETSVVQLFKQERIRDGEEWSEPLQELNLPEICSKSQVPKRAQKVCGIYQNLNLLWILALIVGILSIVMILGIVALGHLCKRNRLLLLIVFRPALYAIQMTVCALMLIHASLLIATFYFLEAWFIGAIHIGVMLSVGLMACVVSFRVLGKIFTSNNHQIECQVLGKRLGRLDYPLLWGFIETLAKEAGSLPPDHIVVGLDPTFFVTQAPVICSDGLLRGRTLFISLPFCRLLLKKEFAAIIVHELAHFAGRDTQFSRWFYPVYRGVSETIGLLKTQMSSNNRGIGTLALFPAFSLIVFWGDTFAAAENGLGRERELSADQQGAMLIGTSYMSSALIKVYAYGPLWMRVKNAMLSAQQQENICDRFEDTISKSSQNEILRALNEACMLHPVDTHPSLMIRLQSLGVNWEQCWEKALSVVPAEAKASLMIDHYEELEKQMSRIAHDTLMTTYSQ